MIVKPNSVRYCKDYIVYYSTLCDRAKLQRERQAREDAERQFKELEERMRVAEEKEQQRRLGK